MLLFNHTFTFNFKKIRKVYPNNGNAEKTNIISKRLIKCHKNNNHMCQNNNNESIK